MLRYRLIKLDFYTDSRFEEGFNTKLNIYAAILFISYHESSRSRRNIYMNFKCSVQIHIHQMLLYQRVVSSLKERECNVGSTITDDKLQWRFSCSTKELVNYQKLSAVISQRKSHMSVLNCKQYAHASSLNMEIRDKTTCADIKMSSSEVTHNSVKPSFCLFFKSIVSKIIIFLVNAQWGYHS